MLTIRSPEGFQSFAPFDEIELPDFVVVTGLNASGKTQLLRGIENGPALVERDGVEVSVERRHYFQSLGPTIEDHIETGSYLQTLTNFGDNVSAILRDPRRADEAKILFAIAEKVGVEDPARLDHHHLRGFGLPFQTRRRRAFGSSPFRYLVATALRSWQLEIDYHNYNRYLASVGQPTKSPPLSDAEFEQRYGEPLEAPFNAAIEPLGYALSGEGLRPAEVNADMCLRLRHLERGHEIAFSELSSGEQAVLSLLVYAFINQDAPSDNEPSVMLLDEVDASLHPQLMRKFIDDLRATLVDRGTSIILATHSPSMVALAPEESIFAMSAEGEPRLRQVTKDHALGMLTEGVPSLRVDHRNCRQVFVEADLDAALYTGIYQNLRPHLEPEIALSFIAAGGKRRNPANDAKLGDDGGGCAAVRRLVKELRGAGNDRVYGIVDRDRGATDGDGVYVVGDGNAYAIENVLLDPLLVAALAAHEGALVNTSFASVTFLELCMADPVLLSRLAECVCGRVCPDAEGSAERVTLSYVEEGISIQSPRWYLEMRGHDLAQHVLRAFPKLNAVTKGDVDRLAKAVVERVLREKPGFTPRSLLDLMRRIQAGERS